MQRLDRKDPSIRYIETVKFTAVLSTGEYVTWATAQTVVIRPTEDAVNDASAVVGTVLASADTALVEIEGGTHRQSYASEILASTSLGNVWSEVLVWDVWSLL